MSDNPFAEPNDSDRTVVRGPGGAAPPPRPAQPQPRLTPAPVEDRDDGLVHSHGWACGQRGRPSH